ncbi:Spata17, partial [Symbiodinium sp. KB8]
AVEVGNDKTTLIQKVYRGHRQRSKLQRHIRAAVHIQRIRRGYLARRAVEEGLEAKRKAAEAAVLEYYVRLVQAAFRGFYSRKYTHDFYARKAYIATVQQRGEALRAEMEEHHRQLQQAEMEREERQMRQEFDSVTQGLHHLLSTKSVPGVFNPPVAAATGTLPTAFNRP